MVPILSPCSAAKRSSSGRRAMLPSSLSISTITAEGSNPARRARSQPASVWPARVSTPPGCAMSGKMWPGCTRSSARASRATAARHQVQVLRPHAGGGHYEIALVLAAFVADDDHHAPAAQLVDDLGDTAE